MSAAQSKEAVRRWFEIWNSGRFEELDQLIDPSAEVEDPVSGSHRGPNGVREFMATYREAFPDLHFHVEEMVTEDDRVAVRWTSHGTHEGKLMDLSPTGKKVETAGIAIMRVADGRITGGDGQWDAIGMFRQLGTMPEPAGAGR